MHLIQTETLHCMLLCIMDDQSHTLYYNMTALWRVERILWARRCANPFPFVCTHLKLSNHPHLLSLVQPFLLTLTACPLKHKHIESACALAPYVSLTDEEFRILSRRRRMRVLEQVAQLVRVEGGSRSPSLWGAVLHWSYPASDRRVIGLLLHWSVSGGGPLPRECVLRICAFFVRGWFVK